MGYALERQTGLKQVAALSLQTCITVHEAHPLAKRPFVRITDLSDESLVMPNDDQRLRHVLNGLFARVGIKPNFTVTTNSFEFIAIMVGKGLGIGCQIRVRPGADPARPEIVYIPIEDPDIHPSVLACYISDTQPSNMAVMLCVKELQTSLQSWCDDDTVAIDQQSNGIPTFSGLPQLE